MSERSVSVQSYAVHVPGANVWETGGAAVPGEPMCSAEEAQQVLGRKGLLMKEPATRLALCAVHRALGLPLGKVGGPLPLADRTAVVVSSNLGNLRTVCGIAAAVGREDYRVVSPMETPNVSSNVIASTIAVRYGFTGPNVMVCNGATSGLDAVRLGARLIRAGRAEQAIVVGVEPADEVSQSLVKSRDPHTYGRRGTPTLRAAAACVILGKPGTLGKPVPFGKPGTGTRSVMLGDSGTLPPAAQVPTDHPGLTFAPYGIADESDSVVDLTARLGETYGALGVLQVAAAAATIGAGGVDAAHVACGDAIEGYTWLDLAAGDVRG
ncbi:3-oxoacyl-[acyl-carrier-protein] synthase II [Kitasatospora sp. MAP12-15]|uniref:beta-ketoacyl synthase N-terminal-like domain-containing protein n=1 Tax=unclassified Kitasatospora TaxID=2633591 RepID=UPI00247604F3|nr:beta-ketoacyl synthase N-terminal-like domain-containing protein [Kitasatospora sp. MAP12-44]MDH6108613.1 3-oxoacyl-[acyl-carrier-protein] synthase II [Kitasatospora sp. MAP12-44]